MPESPTQNKSTEKKFERSIWKVCGIVALILAVLWILKETFNVLLLVLAGALIAIYFHGLSRWLTRRTKISYRSSMALSVTVTVLAVSALVYFSGARMQAQIAE